MRTLILISIFACIYLHFQQKEAELATVDTLSLKQSSVKKIHHKESKVEMPAITHLSSETKSEHGPSLNDQMITEADISEEYTEDEISQLPWDDIDEGWKTHLKEYLSSVDPEKAEDMFSAYLEEKKKYVERVDYSESDGISSEGSSATIENSMVEQDTKGDDLEAMHTNNLKEIFGDHYGQIEALHKEYVESVQYMNRTSMKFTISL